MTSPLRREAPVIQDIHTLISKHGGFFWKFPDKRGEVVCFASEEQRDGFDRELRSLGGEFDVHLIDPLDEDQAPYHEDWENERDY